MAIENPPQLEVLLGKSSMEYVLLPRLIPEGPHHSNHLQLYSLIFLTRARTYFLPISMMTTPMHSKCLAEWSRWNGRCDHLQCRFEPHAWDGKLRPESTGVTGVVSSHGIIFSKCPSKNIQKDDAH